MHSSHGSCFFAPLSIRSIHIQIKPHQLRSRDSTPARHAEKRMARVQSDWALEAFTFVYLPMTAIVRFAVTTERKQTSMGKTRSKGAGSHWQITRPRYLAPVDGTRPVGLNLQSFVKVVTLLMLFSKGWQRTRRHCPRSEEKCKKTLRPQPFAVELREMLHPLLSLFFFVCTCPRIFSLLD